MSITKVQTMTPGQRVSRGNARHAASGKVETAARETGSTARVVRHYARIGLVMPRRDPRHGYKLFTDHPLTCKQRTGLW